MGLYSYRCGTCAHSFDARHPYKDTLKICPECREDSLQRVLSKPIKILGKKKKVHSQAGNIVKKSIEEAQEEIKKEKQTLQKRVEK